MIWTRIEKAHIAAGIPINISYGWPIPPEIMSAAIESTGFFRALVQPVVDTESVMSKSTAGDIESLTAQMVVIARTDEKAYHELQTWLQTIWYENENGRFGKPAVSSKDLGVTPDIIRIRDWHPVGGFMPDMFDAGNYKGAGQPVMIQVEQ